MKNWFTYKDIENIKRLYKDGKSFEEIADIIGCTAIATEMTLRAERVLWKEIVMKYTKFKDIPQFTKDANYNVNNYLLKNKIYSK